MSSDFFFAIAICMGFLSIIVCSEILMRKGFINVNISRRFSHIASGLFAIYMALNFSPELFLLCNGGLLIFIALSYWRNLLRSVHNVKRKTYGEVFLPLGIFVTYALWHNTLDVFVTAVLVVTIADAAAGIIGDLRRNARSSRIGSVVFFACTITILLLSGHSIPEAASIAFITTVVEKISPYGSDNLTIPITIAMLVSLL